MNDEIRIPEPAPGSPPVRTNMLTVLCILTFIGSGMNLVSNLTIAGFHDLFTQIAIEFAEKFNIPGMEMLAESPPSFFLTNSLFYATSLAGAILMFRLRKNGFHVYTVSQILLIITPMLFLHLPGPGIPELLFSGIFIFLYWSQIRNLNG